MIGIAQLRHAEGTGGNAVTTAIADIILNDHGVEPCANDRSCRAGIEAGGVDAVLANVTEHQPGSLGGSGHEEVGKSVPRRRGRLFHERNVTPGRRSQIRRIVIAKSRQAEAAVGAIGGELVPLLARYLTGLAADAERGVR